MLTILRLSRLLTHTGISYIYGLIPYFAQNTSLSLPSASIQGLLYMATELIVTTFGVIIGLPIAMFGFMRLEERSEKWGAVLLLIGLLTALGPIGFASLSHYRATNGAGRYSSW